MARVAVVTGANKGIGFEIVRGLLKQGPDNLRVIMCARDKARGQESLDKLKKELTSKGDRLTLEQLDIGSEASINEFTSVVKEKYGQLDILIHNAAVAFKNSDPTPFQQQAAPTFGVNYFGTFNLNKSVAPLLHASADPRVIIIASQVGKSSFGNCSKDLQKRWSAKFSSASKIDDLANEFIRICEKEGSDGLKAAGWPTTCYGTSKLAVLAHAKFLAQQNENEKIFIASVCPGYCSTDMTSHGGSRSAAKGAETPVYLALLPKETIDAKHTKSGEFWYDKEIISFL